jgi:membrane-associated HD superfamily phosphohydrolase
MSSYLFIGIGQNNFIIRKKRKEKKRKKKVSRSRRTPIKNNNIIINRGFVLGSYGKSRKNLYTRHESVVVG